MSLTFVITDNISIIELKKEDARDLELKLNVTSKGHTWNYIGDALFNFHTETQIYTEAYVVTTEELNFLNKIIRLTKEQCKNV
jgi:hypothetical protein